MAYMRRISAARNRLSAADVIKWWPTALIGPILIAIRLDGVPGLIGMWVWAPTAVALVILLVLRHTRLVLSPDVALFGGYVSYSALSLLWSPDPGRGLRFVALIGVAYLAFLYGRTIGAPTGSSALWQAGFVGLALALAALLVIQDPADFEILNPDRILGMGVLALVVIAWYGPRGRLLTLGLGVLALGTILLSDSRTTSLVMVLLLMTAPGLRLPRSGRWLLFGILMVLAILISLTPGFQERWFESGEGNLWDLVRVQGLDTSGRAEVWPVVADSCRHFVLGEGAGASDSFAFEAHSGFPEPHNEYLRVWCDGGLVGSVLFWGFVAWIGVGAVVGLRRSPRSWAHLAAAQMAAALLYLSLTDNPLTTTIPFMVPAALAFGWSQHQNLSDPDDQIETRLSKLPPIDRRKGP